MATQDYLYDPGQLRQNGRRIVVPSIGNFHQHLVQQGIPLMLLDFRITSGEFYRKGQFIFERYKQSRKRRGPFKFQEGIVHVDYEAGVMMTNVGLRRDIYRLNEAGDWTLVRQSS